MKNYIFFAILLVIAYACIYYYRSPSLFSSKDNTQDLRLQLITMMNAHVVSRGLFVASELKIADQLSTGSRPIHELAHALNVNADALNRLMRVLSSHGIFKQIGQDTYGLNPISELLRSDHPESLRIFLGHDDQTRWQAYGDMLYSIKTGKASFDHLFDMPYFDYLLKHPELQNRFDETMANFSEQEDRAIVDTFDFSSCASLVDVGGGKGSLLSALLHKNKNMQGVLYDLEQVMPRAKEYLTEQGVIQRVSLIGGSFFDSVPEGYDCYILKRIMHDWSDQDVLTILGNCKKAMRSNSRLFVIDAIISNDDAPHIAKDVDMIMLMLFGAQERTEKEFKVLFDKADLEIKKITHIESQMVSIIELVVKQ